MGSDPDFLNNLTTIPLLSPFGYSAHMKDSTWFVDYRHTEAG